MRCAWAATHRCAPGWWPAPAVQSIQWTQLEGPRGGRSTPPPPRRNLHRAAPSGSDTVSRLARARVISPLAPPTATRSWYWSSATRRTPTSGALWAASTCRVCTRCAPAADANDLLPAPDHAAQRDGDAVPDVAPPFWRSRTAAAPPNGGSRRWTACWCRTTGSAATSRPFCARRTRRATSAACRRAPPRSCCGTHLRPPFGVAGTGAIYRAARSTSRPTPDRRPDAGGLRCPTVRGGSRLRGLELQRRAALRAEQPERLRVLRPAGRSVNRDASYLPRGHRAG